MAETPRILDGYKVLDFTQVLAGPTTTRYMAEMGAEVVKVEIAPTGDISRAVPFIRDGRSGYYVQQNRGKKSLCLNVKKPAGLALLKELVPKFDVLVENYSPGTIGRIGLDYPTVKALNPKIIMCSISTFGQGGPLAKRPGYDFIGCAYSGVLSMLGDIDRTPVLPQVGIGDITTGVHALSAITAALLHRERTGKGQYVETSLLDCYFSYQDLTVQTVSLTNGEVLPRRSGSHHFAIAPLGIFKGKRQPIIVMAGAEHQFPDFCRAMGRPELASDPRFKDIPARKANIEELKRIVQEWFDSTPSDEAALALLEEHRVPHGPVLAVEEAMAHPHHRERGVVQTIEDRFLGTFDVPGFPLRFSEFPDRRAMTAPTLGEHNAEILRDYLGYPQERVQQLEADGILHRGPR
ncbi:MAG: CaiB/BaiF CoA transferase family protein [Candidatus Binataceae bacterium]